MQDRSLLLATRHRARHQEKSTGENFYFPHSTTPLASTQNSSSPAPRHFFCTAKYWRIGRVGWVLLFPRHRLLCRRVLSRKTGSKQKSVPSQTDERSSASAALSANPFATEVNSLPPNNFSSPKRDANISRTAGTKADPPVKK